MTPSLPEPRPATEILVRHCHGLKQFQACYELQRRVWGNSDIDVPVPVFVVAAETGGQVLGAFLGSDGDVKNLIGFTMAVAGWRNSAPFLHSHMTAVLNEYRDRGVGRRLKLFQREDALNRGIELVEWTFDPLEVKNAYFNFVRLGAIARRYLPNCYGITNSPLHGGLPTDRLVAEWYLRSPRALAAMGGAGSCMPGQRLADPKTILVPSELEKMKRDAPADALQTQARIRGEFQQLFAAGYVATSMQVNAECGCYTLERMETY